MSWRKEPKQFKAGEPGPWEFISVIFPRYTRKGSTGWFAMCWRRDHWVSNMVTGGDIYLEYRRFDDPPPFAAHDEGNKK
jgi:hypothetical protein